MARGVNKVILVGRLGKDPEVRYMPSGGAVANASIATSEQWKDKQTGEQKERTEWHNLVFYNRLAEVVGEYLKKGAEIYVEGMLRTRKWEKDVFTRYYTEIIVNDMQMLGGRSGGDNQNDRQSSGGQGRADNPNDGRTDGFGGEFDDDIPF